MGTIGIRELADLFEGETLTLLGGFLDESLEKDKISDDLVLALDSGIGIFPGAAFWCMDNFQKEWEEIGPLVKHSETRIFTPHQMEVDRNWIYYIPHPIWAMPGDDVKSWRAGSKGDECPIGWGSLCLGIGIAYRLGFNRVKAVGCLPGDKFLRWDIRKGRFEDFDGSIEGQYKTAEQTARTLSEMLDVQVVYTDERSRR